MRVDHLVRARVPGFSDLQKDFRGVCPKCGSRNIEQPLDEHGDLACICGKRIYKGVTDFQLDANGKPAGRRRKDYR